MLIQFIKNIFSTPSSSMTKSPKTCLPYLNKILTFSEFVSEQNLDYNIRVCVGDARIINKKEHNQDDEGSFKYYTFEFENKVNKDNIYIQASKTSPLCVCIQSKSKKDRNTKYYVGVCRSINHLLKDLKDILLKSEFSEKGNEHVDEAFKQYGYVENHTAGIELSRVILTPKFMNVTDKVDNVLHYGKNFINETPSPSTHITDMDVFVERVNKMEKIKDGHINLCDTLDSAASPKSYVIADATSISRFDITSVGCYLSYYHDVKFSEGHYGLTARLCSFGPVVRYNIAESEYNAIDYIVDVDAEPRLYDNILSMIENIRKHARKYRPKGDNYTPYKEEPSARYYKYHAVYRSIFNQVRNHYIGEVLKNTNPDSKLPLCTDDLKGYHWFKSNFLKLNN